MEITNDFKLGLAPDDAYTLLLDLERVAPCMPGATLGEELEDGTRKLTVTVRLGPMKFVYGGTVRISERDDAQRRAVLVGAARESRGQGTANATITMTVSSAGETASRVDSVAQIDLTGRAAQTGRGIVEDVSRRMVAQMAECLAAKAAAAPPAGADPTGHAGAGAPPAAAGGARAVAGSAAPEPAQEIRAGSLFWSLLWERLSRLWRRRR
jgi:carbon monoxide dehydrogenase subunit G